MQLAQRNIAVGQLQPALHAGLWLHADHHLSVGCRQGSDKPTAGHERANPVRLWGADFWAMGRLECVLKQPILCICMPPGQFGLPAFARHLCLCTSTGCCKCMFTLPSVEDAWMKPMNRCADLGSLQCFILQLCLAVALDCAAATLSDACAVATHQSKCNFAGPARREDRDELAV